jgi:hypothetical protein
MIMFKKSDLSRLYGKIKPCLRISEHLLDLSTSGDIFVRLPLGRICDLPQW